MTISHTLTFSYPMTFLAVFVNHIVCPFLGPFLVPLGQGLAETRSARNHETQQPRRACCSRG
jgi:hypothetical protein